MAHDHDDGAGFAYGEGEYGLTPAGAGHEHTDANVWVIVKFMLWLAAAAIIIHIGMGLIFGLFVETREETDPLYPLAAGQAQRVPAEPRLQGIPVNDIYRFRLQEQQVLEGYGWISRDGGRVQIPIEEAMRLTVERGLPARAAQPEEAQQQPGATPGLLPADSSAGRTMERRRQ